MFKAALLVQERLEKHVASDGEFASEYASALNDSLCEYIDELTSDIAMAASLGDVESWAAGTLKNEPACVIKFDMYTAYYTKQYEQPPDFETKVSAQARCLL